MFQLALLTLLGVAAASDPRKVHDYDAPYFELAKETILAKGSDPSRRISAMRELVTRDATRARELIAGALDDPNPQVQRRAAEWLAAYGDKRGAEWEARCLENSACPEQQFHAVRLLGISKDRRYAAPIRTRVTRAFQSGRVREGRWVGSANDRAMLKYGVLALARMGRPEDVDLILEVVKVRPSSDFLEPLGYIDDRRSRNILWSAYRSLSGVPTCSGAALGVPALIPLSRLGEEKAVDALKDILRGIGTPSEPWEHNRRPSLCADRAEAFRNLRRRDARNFSETVLEIAGQQPEGPGTFEAWQALGMMRPEGFGPRVLSLAISRTRWKFVSHDVLNTVVLSLDPDLHDEFWAAYEDAQVIPAQLGKRRRINEGLGYLLFSGTGAWTGE